MTILSNNYSRRRIDVYFLAFSTAAGCTRGHGDMRRNVTLYIKDLPETGGERLNDPKLQKPYRNTKESIAGRAGRSLCHQPAVSPAGHGKCLWRNSLGYLLYRSGIYEKGVH